MRSAVLPDKLILSGIKRGLTRTRQTLNVAARSHHRDRCHLSTHGNQSKGTAPREQGRTDFGKRFRKLTRSHGWTTREFRNYCVTWEHRRDPVSLNFIISRRAAGPPGQSLLPRLRR